MKGKISVFILCAILVFGIVFLSVGQIPPRYPITPIQELVEFESGLQADFVQLADTGDAYWLKLRWNEAASADRILSFKANAGNRTIDLSGDLTLSGSNKVAGWEVTGNLQNTAAALTIQSGADQNVTVFGSATTGETPAFTVSGYRGSDSLRVFSLAVGSVAADTATITGLSNYTFDGAVAIADAAVGDDGRALSSIAHLAAGGKSDGIAAYFEGHINNGVTTDGSTYSTGAWLNIDSGATLGADVRALDIGIYESGATCTGRNAYGLAIHMEFDSTNAPNNIYPFRINCNSTANHATPAALIFAPNTEALGLVEANPGTADDAYLLIHMQNGDVYRIPLVKE